MLCSSLSRSRDYPRNKISEKCSFVVFKWTAAVVEANKVKADLKVQVQYSALHCVPWIGVKYHCFREESNARHIFHCATTGSSIHPCMVALLLWCHPERSRWNSPLFARLWLKDAEVDRRAFWEPTILIWEKRKFTFQSSEVLSRYSTYSSLYNNVHYMFRCKRGSMKSWPSRDCIKQGGERMYFAMLDAALWELWFPWVST